MTDSFDVAEHDSPEAHDAGSAESPAPSDGTAGADDARVTAALTRLDDLEGADVHEHAEVFADVHARLSAALADAGPAAAR